MANNDNVQYDKTGVPVPISENDGSNYSVNLSNYFYTKLNSIRNSNDFSNADITNYELDVSNGNINISTTGKLINYLKSLINVNVSKLNSKIDTKLDSDDYVVDTALKSNSTNPVTNKAINTKFTQIEGLFDNKSNVGHVHNMSEVNSLDTTIANLTNTIGTKSNLNHSHSANDISIDSQNFGIETTNSQNEINRLLSIFNNYSIDRMSLKTDEITWTSDSYVYFTRIGFFVICEYWLVSVNSLENSENNKDKEYVIGNIPLKYQPYTPTFHDNYSFMGDNPPIRVAWTHDGEMRVNVNKTGRINTIDTHIYLVNTGAYKKKEPENLFNK